MIKHLLDIQDLSPATWETLIQDTISISKTSIDKLKERKIADNSNQAAFLFLEPSTRTYFSFSIAAQKMGIHVHVLNSHQSSLSKGETIEDTLLNLEAMGVRSTIIRLKEENILSHISKSLKTMSLICAGEGKTSHPSQALLDATTIYEHFNRLDNLKILFLGDIEHSRVYASNLKWLNWYNNSIYALSSNTKKLININEPNTELGPWENYLAEFDVIIMIRPQLERHTTPSSMNLSEYHHEFGINLDRFKKLKPTSILMHPGPFYPKTEFSQELLSDKRFKIYRQVYWGIFARMSIFNHILG